MEAVVSVLLGEFVGYVKSNWSAHSQVNQRQHRLRQLVLKVRAVVDYAGARAAVRDEALSCWLQLLRSEAMRGQEVLDGDAARAAAVATSARGFLAGLKELVVRSAEAERLADTVDQLELLAWRDLEVFVRLSLDAATEQDMDVDGRPAPGARRRRGQKGRSGCICGTVGTVVALVPSRGAKRACDDVDAAGSTSRGEVNAVQPPKRRRPAWMLSHQGLPSGFGRVSSAPRVTPVAELRRSPRLALAMSRIQREASLRPQFLRITF